MQTIAIMKAAPVSDQKARLVADQVRGLPVAKALNLLTFQPEKIGCAYQESAGVGYRQR